MMNEQLQRLVRQAGFCGTGFHNTLPGTTQEDALKNFAELIVRECIAVHKDDYGVDIIGDVLKKHFGVE
jgi:hypothetical protein